jgi:hypothetical protein
MSPFRTCGRFFTLSSTTNVVSSPSDPRSVTLRDVWSIAITFACTVTASWRRIVP